MKHLTTICIVISSFSNWFYFCFSHRIALMCILRELYSRRLLAENIYCTYTVLCLYASLSLFWWAWSCFICNVHHPNERTLAHFVIGSFYNVCYVMKLWHIGRAKITAHGTFHFLFVALTLCLDTMSASQCYSCMAISFNAWLQFSRYVCTFFLFNLI